MTARSLGPGFSLAGARPSCRSGAGPKQIDLLTDQTLWFIQQNKDRPSS